MRFIPKTCEKCGKTYRYMLSGSSSPSDWNRAQGVTWKYCKVCSEKTFMPPEFQCPPVERFVGKLRTFYHNWMMKHSWRYRKEWRCGRVPDRMIDMGPLTIKPFPKVDHPSSIYFLEFDIDNKK